MDVDDFIDALKNNNKHLVKILMDSVEQASADILEQTRATGKF